MKPARIEYRIAGKSYEVIAGEHETVLDCALRNSIPAPYSCMEGVCSSCTALVLEGEVEDFVGHAPIEARVQTCQMRIKPGCPKLILDYER
ncbi:MAG: 2Fe-2S iron-sulfur cluster binding domain-containing protein [Bdellovibrionaceae bacterium]|nr:2Fe-2S iron-sulfur cluster binding domain-containing protein [Pseudobdellovibrionaceae bacterium]